MCCPQLLEGDRAVLHVHSLSNIVMCSVKRMLYLQAAKAYWSLRMDCRARGGVAILASNTTCKQCIVQHTIGVQSDVKTRQTAN